MHLAPGASRSIRNGGTSKARLRFLILALLLGLQVDKTGKQHFEKLPQKTRLQLLVLALLRLHLATVMLQEARNDWTWALDVYNNIVQCM